MCRIKTLWIILSAIGVLPCHMVAAQPDSALIARLESSIAAHASVISGADKLQGIPLDVRMRAFLRNYSRVVNAGAPAASLLLNAADSSLLSELVSQHEGFLRAGFESQRLEFDRACRELLADKTDIVSFLSTAERAAEQHRESRTRYYETFMGRLSPAGRALIESAVNEHAKGITLGVTNYAGIASEIPDVMAAHYKQSCINSAQRVTSPVTVTTARGAGGTTLAGSGAPVQ